MLTQAQAVWRKQQRVRVTPREPRLVRTGSGPELSGRPQLGMQQVPASLTFSGESLKVDACLSQVHPWVEPLHGGGGGLPQAPLLVLPGALSVPRRQCGS